MVVSQAATVVGQVLAMGQVLAGQMVTVDQAVADGPASRPNGSSRPSNGGILNVTIGPNGISEEQCLGPTEELYLGLA